MPRRCYVYIITNVYHTVLYTGVTNNLQRRVAQHRSRCGGKFTSRYNLTKLVYFELFERPRNAISREKQIKAGPRRKKIELVQSLNPEWNDLSAGL